MNRVEDTEHVVIPVQLREKYKQSGYNHTSTPLFGQPFLITVPRTLSEDKLYNMLLLRLWYASPLPSVPSLHSFFFFLFPICVVCPGVLNFDPRHIFPCKILNFTKEHDLG